MMNDSNNFQDQNFPTELTNSLAQVETGSLIASAKSELDGSPITINVYGPSREDVQQVLAPELLGIHDALRDTGLGATEFELNVRTCVSGVDITARPIIDATTNKDA